MLLLLLILLAVSGVLGAPAAAAVARARGNDCGPERSLRTAPSSSSLPPAGGCLRIPSGASTPRARATAAAT
ncbi:hypothetical protein, partial [Achromobacter insuavis]|uniref:hypothetical protein n=1 Tax=Achromobacter insuavis TaxID=1287735 RepID=UPI001F147F68